MRTLASTLVGSFCLLASGHPLVAQSTQCVSVTPGGGPGNHSSDYGSMTPDGRFIVFVSESSDLVSGDTNNAADVFVHDMQAGTTERINLGVGGTEANGGSPHHASLSADGRFVAFNSWATNLVPNDTNGLVDVFVHDRQSGTTERVSVDSNGVQSNGDTLDSMISADGRYIAFLSQASNLVPNDTNSALDVFVRDRLLGTTERVSVGPNGIEGNGPCDMNGWPQISADGRLIAFASLASNLVSNDTNGYTDIFVRDRQFGTTERISMGLGGLQTDRDSYSPKLSPDGRFVGFSSLATNIVLNDTNGCQDAFLYDRLNGTTERVSLGSNGVQGYLESWYSGASTDGRFIAFSSNAPNLVLNDTNGTDDGFVRDRLLGTTERVTVDSSGAQGNGSSSPCTISADGRYVLIQSLASNFVSGDANAGWDVFLRDRGAPPLVSFCTPGQAGVIACPCANPPSGSGHGCDNSAATGGATLAASGSASLSSDTLAFASAGETPSATSIVVQGTSASFTGVVFGQGVRCVAGTLKRLYVETASGGSIVAPSAGQAPVSVRSAQLGDLIQAGEHRFVMVQYRDPQVLGNCPAASTFNATQALDVPWSQ